MHDDQNYRSKRWIFLYFDYYRNKRIKNRITAFCSSPSSVTDWNCLPAQLPLAYSVGSSFAESFDPNAKVHCRALETLDSVDFHRLSSIALEFVHGTEVPRKENLSKFHVLRQ